MSTLAEETNKLVSTILITSFDKFFFSYGISMQKKQVDNNNIFLDLVSTKYRPSMKVLLEARELVVTEINESILLKFKTKAAIYEYLKSLQFQK